MTRCVVHVNGNQQYTNLIVGRRFFDHRSMFIRFYLSDLSFDSNRMSSSSNNMIIIIVYFKNTESFTLLVQRSMVGGRYAVPGWGEISDKRPEPKRNHRTWITTAMDGLFSKIDDSVWCVHADIHRWGFWCPRIDLYSTHVHAYHNIYVEMCVGEGSSRIGDRSCCAGGALE